VTITRFAIIVTVFLLATPLAAGAQPAGKVLRVGVLANGSAATSPPVDAFRQGLRDFGYIEGQNIALEIRWAEGRFEHLSRVVGLAAAGHGQVVAIVGEAGVGKSRLTYEFTHSHRVQDWRVLAGSSVSYGKATSFAPVIDLLKGYFTIEDRDEHREMRAKVLGGVLGLDRALEHLLTPLLALLEVPVEEPAWQALDPAQRQRHTLDAVKQLLLQESRVQPLLVVLEDLHWIDVQSQALLDSLVEGAASARLLLLVNYRPEYEHRWGNKTVYSQLRLDSLPAEGTAELLAALLGPDPGLAPLTQMLVKRGNPFFLEETVRGLVETGALVGVRGAYRLTGPLEALQIPPTVQTILATRIDRLPPEEKRLLQVASVIGKDVPHALLARRSSSSQRTPCGGGSHIFRMQSSSTRRGSSPIGSSRSGTH
jgi:predicted ATPase